MANFLFGFSAAILAWVIISFFFKKSTDRFRKKRIYLLIAGIIALILGFLFYENESDSEEILTQKVQLEAPAVISVAEWNGKAPTGEIESHEITHITVHHAGVVFPEDKDPYEYMRGLQKFSQVDKEWIDIPYHYTIDMEGNIFENRPLKYPGDTNTEYDPTGHALIHVVGNYEVQEVRPEQIKAIAHLSAWLAREYNVPMDHIASHKDHSDQTVCPGKDLYKYFEDGTIKKEIQALLSE